MAPASSVPRKKWRRETPFGISDSPVPCFSPMLQQRRSCSATLKDTRMKISKFTVMLLLAGGLTAIAEEYPEFVTWMKTTGTASDELKKMEQKTGEEAMRRAEKIAGVYENMIGFWRQRNMSDAVKWSEDGKAAAMQLAT